MRLNFSKLAVVVAASLIGAGTMNFASAGYRFYHHLNTTLPSGIGSPSVPADPETPSGPTEEAGEWLNSGEVYGCSNWYPAPNTHPTDEEFLQTSDSCSQAQINSVSGSPRIVTASSTQSAIGTKAVERFNQTTNKFYFYCKNSGSSRTARTVFFNNQLVYSDVINVKARTECPTYAGTALGGYNIGTQKAGHIGEDATDVYYSIIY